MRAQFFLLFYPLALVTLIYNTTSDSQQTAHMLFSKLCPAGQLATGDTNSMPAALQQTTILWRPRGILSKYMMYDGSNPVAQRMPRWLGVQRPVWVAVVAKQPRGAHRGKLTEHSALSNPLNPVFTSL